MVSGVSAALSAFELSAAALSVFELSAAALSVLELSAAALSAFVLLFEDAGVLLELPHPASSDVVIAAASNDEITFFDFIKNPSLLI